MLGSVEINFDQNSLMVLNIIIAVMMFGVALTLRVEDFRRVVTQPRAPLAGLFTQFVLLPALTCLATWVFDIRADLALGMLLVSSCPGGTFSNLMTWIARGNVAVSVSMTAISSLAATVLTPLNFAFYAHLNPSTRALFQDIYISSFDILILVVLVLGVPIVLGMLVGTKFPRFALRSEKPLRIFAMLTLLAFVGIAFQNNFDVFTRYFSLFFWLVVLHNAGALLIGRGVAQLLKLPQSETRAVTLEVGIQNSGLGLVILFNFMPDQGGMMLITAFWGVWHLVSGIVVSQIWSRIPITDGSEPALVQATTQPN